MLALSIEINKLLHQTDTEAKSDLFGRTPLQLMLSKCTVFSIAEAGPVRV